MSYNPNLRSRIHDMPRTARARRFSFFISSRIKYHETVCSRKGNAVQLYICGTVKDYGTKGHRVARRDRLSPVAKRETRGRRVVESSASSVAQFRDGYSNGKARRSLVDHRPLRTSLAA